MKKSKYINRYLNPYNSLKFRHKLCHQTHEYFTIISIQKDYNLRNTNLLNNVNTITIFKNNP